MFKKYPSIENTYRQKHIDYWLERYPELADETYIVQEKLHGANIQLIFDAAGNFVAPGSRNNQLGIGTSFYNIWSAIAKLDETDLFINMRKFICNNPLVDSVVLYGELFGGSVQKGVDYGPEQRILFYDVAINGIINSQKAFNDLMLIVLDMGELIVPTICYTNTLEAALQLNIDVDSYLTPDDHIGPNICEGVVIKPMGHYLDDNGSPFYLKKKNEAFKEKQKSQKPVSVKDIDPKFAELTADFEAHLTENRLDAVFSKVGVIDDISHMGRYIKLVSEDAKYDFMKDRRQEIEELAKEDQRRVFSGAGRIIVPMLKARL